MSKHITKDNVKLTNTPDLTSSSAHSEFLDTALECGAFLTGKLDGSEDISVAFSIEAWRKFANSRPQWHKFSDTPPTTSASPVEILWRTDSDVGIGWYCAEDADEWDGEWMLVSEINK